MNVRRIFIIAVIFAILIGAVVYFYVISPQSSNPSSTPSPTPLSSHIFSPKTQFVPKGAESREVDKTLAAFDFSKPLPFFEKDNVVQSLTIIANASNASPPPSTHVTSLPLEQTHAQFLSYRILGQTRTSVRDALIMHFKDLQWDMMDTKGDQKFIFSHMNKQIFVALIDVPHVSATEQLTTVVTLTLRSPN